MGDPLGIGPSPWLVTDAAEANLRAGLSSTDVSQASPWRWSRTSSFSASRSLNRW